MGDASRKILLLITDLKIGGTPTVVRELAIRLHRPPGVQVQVACLAPWGPVADQLQQAGLPVTALGACCAADIRAIWRLRQLIRRERFDTIFSFLIHANVAAAIASIGIGNLRRFQSIQHPWPLPGWHWCLQQFIQGRAERIVVPSPSVASAADQWAGIKSDRIVIIPNGVQTDAFAGLGSMSGPPYRIVFLGRLDPIKRIGDLLAAVASLSGLVHLDIYGQGIERNRIVQEIAMRQIGSWVSLRGTVADPREALKDASILVLPSEAEGFGLVLIEAMAAGVPIVATNAPGIRDVIEDGRTGLLVPVGDPDQLAAAIGKICANPSLRQTLQENAKSVVQITYDWAKIIPLYRHLLGLG